MNIFNIKNIKICILILFIILIVLNIKHNNILKGGNNNFTILKKVNLNNKLLISTSIFVRDITLIDDNKYVKGLYKLYTW